MDGSGGPTGGGGPSGSGPPPGNLPDADPTPNRLSVEEAWHKLNVGLGKTAPELVRKGQLLLNSIDRKTGLKSA